MLDRELAGRSPSPTAGVIDNQSLKALHAADGGWDGAMPVLDALRQRWPELKRLFADGAYDRTKLLDHAKVLDSIVEIVKRHPSQQGFAPLPRRWVVERTLSWLVRYRRLVRDYERSVQASEAMTLIASTTMLVRRWERM